MESLYDVLTNSRYEDEKEVCERYDLFPNKEEWIGKILFIETCEEKPTPELFEREVLLLKEKAEIAPNTMTKLRRDEEVSLTKVIDVVCKIIDEVSFAGADSVMHGTIEKMAEH